MSVHIYRATGTRFIARSRLFGHRNWIASKREHKTYEAAVKEMVTLFLRGGIKRADVIMVADWYDPIQACELVRG